ncbi:c-type cytochrome [Deinococcus sonorensis]|uniref:C-type cytochrome n=2 Tax=Deinococcus sonorensis TaxID=309891 RepID=A0AAU7U5C7_9DEIO
MRRALGVGAALLGALAVLALTAASSGTRPSVPANAQTAPGVLAAQLGCPVCHGQRGQAPLSNIPSLAGQHAEWLEARLEAFRAQAQAGEDGIMPRYARHLTDAQIRALAGAYSRDPLPHPTRVLQAQLVSEGQALYERGRPYQGQIACATCHGSAGSGGTTPLVPRIGGQHGGYVIYRLNVYRQLPARPDQPSAQAMRTVARTLSDRDIQAVAAYVQQLPTGSFQ